MDDKISDSYLRMGFRMESSGRGLIFLYFYQQIVFTISSNLNLNKELTDKLCESYLEAVKKTETEIRS